MNWIMDVLIIDTDVYDDNLLLYFMHVCLCKQQEDDVNSKKSDIFSLLGMNNPFMYNEELIPPEPTFFSTGFNVQRTEQ